MTTLLDEKAAKVAFSTGNDDNVKLAMIWLNRCLKSHVACTISTNPLAPLPTRVLDVASDTHDSIRLLYGKGSFSPYITLSHVWGSGPVITTTKLTLNDRLTRLFQHHRHISMKSLTQTFRDAVTVTRNMSVQYLWIDSLCIIQDSPEDWAAESARMGEYYGNSLFTIAAVWAIGGSGGCVARRDPLELSPCRVRIQFPENVRISGQRQFLRPTTSWDTARDTVNFHRLPLWQRAWVLQERLLSRRILQFSDIQLSWRCPTEEASERAPEGFPRRKHANSKLADIYNAWYDLIMLYGRCNLTKPSDIFPAISSLAAGLGKVIGDTYIAGLWQRDLHRGLLWS
ncbi:HET-domain-containing protein, partial [Cenococcum geophilum 1.58]|uniref:HET-domain-containing protein n=1 Tax=Cenococcum geophilum 1.58 TaxID=794803 RepID=UPI00358F0991